MPELCWELESAAGERQRARSLVLALGGLHVPAFPDIPGRASFAGEAFHSAQWRHDLALAGRRVGVIGTGASAVQLVPAIAPTVARLSVFQRTPAWLLPRPDVGFAPWLQRAFARASGLRLALRGGIFALLEVLSSALTHRRAGFWAPRIAHSSNGKFVNRCASGKAISDRQSVPPHLAKQSAFRTKAFPRKQLLLPKTQVSMATRA